MLCARCSAANPEGARFCNQCGAPLTAPAAPELKRLTVLFCDLVDSVELANRLDPEEWHQMLRSYQAAAGDVVRRHQGHVAQHLGDGLVAYFGYPLAAEGDAQRAVQAALELVAVVTALPTLPAAGPMHARVGLHTGAAVMGEVGSGAAREVLALGDTPNLAARLQAQAPRDSVVVSAATWGMVQAAFTGIDLGEHRLKGLATPVHLHRIVAPRQPAGDDEGSSATAAPLLGRGPELARLQAAWQRARTGAGSCLLLLGEPGIGKSRLARELRQRVAREGGNVWPMRCSAQRSQSPFAPLVQLLGRAVDAGAPHESPAAALTGMLAGLGHPDGNALFAPLADLLGIALPADAATPELSAAALRERTFDAATAVAQAGAAQRPTLLLVEDLHWADPSTLQWLGRLVAGGLCSGLMLLLTARSEFGDGTLAGPAVERLLLEPCGTDDAAALVRALDPQRTLGAAAVARIVDRAEGNPLYLEEFTRAALEADHEDIPATLQEQILARLDRMGPAKAVLQQAAVIGRSFGMQRLRAVSGLDDAALSAALQAGVEAHLLLPLADGGTSFTFRHALLQDAANASLLRSARQACHLRVAEAILAEDEQAAERQPDVLAHHYAEGGQVQAALEHWLKAGQAALERSACAEAAAHARRGLALLGDPTDDAAAMHRELLLLLVLAPALMTLHGATDPQVEQAYRRARRLGERIGNTPKMLVPLWGLWAYELMRGQVGDARQLSLQLAELAGRSSQPMPGLVAAATGGMTLFYQGDMAAARAHFARGIELYGTPQLAARLVRGVNDPGMMCRAFDMLAARLQGDAAAAHRAADALRTEADALPPYPAAFVGCALALLAALDDDPAAAQVAATRAIAIAREQAFEAWATMGSVLQGWARARSDAGPRGLQQLQRSIAAWAGGGARNLLPLFRALLADALLAGGDAAAAHEAALAGLADGAGGEQCWQPELQRLVALALHQRGQPAAALEALAEADRNAGQLGLPAWQARIAASRARLGADLENPA